MREALDIRKNKASFPLRIQTLDKKRVSLAFLIWFSVFSFQFSVPVGASGPSSNRILTYQLRLTDPLGIPVADGTKNIKISFYDLVTAGTRLHTDCGTTGTPVGRKVVFSGGIGTVLIGDTSADASHNCTDASAPVAIPATLFNNTSLFIGISVEADAEMTPRKRVVATGYALNADFLDDLDTSAIGGTTAFVPATNSSGLFTLTGTPTTVVAVITANPSVPPANGLLLDLKNNGVSKFSVDAEGDLIVGSSIVTTGHITPSADDTYDLGDNTHRWRDLYLGPATIHIGTSTADEGTLTYDTTTNKLQIDTIAGGTVEIAGGSGSTGCSVDAAGNFSCTGSVAGGGGSSAAFLNGGNTFGAAGTLGTNDNFALNFETNNTTKMTLDAGGKLGIGTLTPNYDLQIHGGATSYVQLSNTATGNTTLAGFQFGIENTKETNLIQRENAPVNIWTNNLQRMTVDGAGNVGIGVTGPNTALDVAGAFSVREMSAPALSPADQGRIYFDATANKFRVSEHGGAYVDLITAGVASGWTDDGTVVRLTAATDQVGIGTATPTAGSHLTVLQSAFGTTDTVADLNHSFTFTTATATRNINDVLITRTPTINSSGQTLTLQGAVLSVKNQAKTQTAGTISDSTKVLEVMQNESTSTGAAISAFSNSSSAAAAVDIQRSAGSIALQVGNNTTLDNFTVANGGNLTTRGTTIGFTGAGTVRGGFGGAGSDITVSGGSLGKVILTGGDQSGAGPSNATIQLTHSGAGSTGALLGLTASADGGSGTSARGIEMDLGDNTSGTGAFSALRINVGAVSAATGPKRFIDLRDTSCSKTIFNIDTSGNISFGNGFITGCAANAPGRDITIIGSTPDAGNPGALKGGDITMKGGNAFVNTSGNANAGSLILDGGAAVGTGTSTVTIGGTNATTVNIGRAGSTTTLNGTLSFNSNLNPAIDNTYDLGTTALRWKTLHVGPGSLTVHNDATNTLKATLGFSGATAQLATDAATALQLTTGANVGLNMTIGGNVGVGTASPITQLHVPGKTPAAALASVATVGTNVTRIFVQGRYAYLGENAFLEIFDVSDPATPISVSSVASAGGINGVSVQGKYAYTVNSANTFQIFDVSNPFAPTSVASVAAGTAPIGIYVQGKYAYIVTNTSNTLLVFDVSNPTAPVQVSPAVATGTNPYSIFIQGRYAYVANGGSATLQIFDVSNPELPVSVGTVATDTLPISVHVQGRYAYVTAFTSGTLNIYDVKNPASPALVSGGTFSLGGQPDGVYVQGKYAYVANSASSTLQVVDVSNPGAPVSAGSVSSATNPRQVFVLGRYAFTANQSSNTLKTFDFGGSYVQQFEAGGIETGTLNVRSNLQAMDAAFGGGVTIGSHLNVSGRFGVQSGELAIGDLKRVTPIYIRGTGLANNAARVLIIGDNTVYNTASSIGLTLTIINKSDHSVVSTTTYDTFNTTTPSDNLATALNGITNAQIGILTSYDAWEGQITANLRTAFRRLGLTKAAVAIADPGTASTWRKPYAAIFEAATGSTINTAKAVEVMINNDANSPYAEIRGWLMDGAFATTESTITNSIYNLKGDVIALIADDTGNIGIGTTTPSKLLDVQGAVELNLPGTGTANALCHTTQTGTTNEEIVDCTGAPIADYAENYPTVADVAIGDIVALGPDQATTKDGETLRKLVKATKPYARGIMGIVSDPAKATDFNVIGYNIKDQDHPLPVALSGRVSATVSIENGSIAPGDPITASSMAGVGMKATDSGMIVGFALDAYDKTGPGKLLVFVNPGWWNGNDLESKTSSSGIVKLQDLTIDADQDMNGFGITNVRFMRGNGELWGVDMNGRIYAKTVETDLIRMKQTNSVASIDRGVLSMGQTTVQVLNRAITPASRVFVTFRKNPGGAWWVDSVGDGFFVLRSSMPPITDAPFDYWLIDVADLRFPQK